MQFTLVTSICSVNFICIWLMHVISLVKVTVYTVKLKIMHQFSECITGWIYIQVFMISWCFVVIFSCVPLARRGLDLVLLGCIFSLFSLNEWQSSCCFFKKNSSWSWIVTNSSQILSSTWQFICFIKTIHFSQTINMNSCD
jgi:hypothetical protein